MLRLFVVISTTKDEEDMEDLSPDLNPLFDDEGSKIPNPYVDATAPVRLIVDQSPDGQVDATVRVRWCIDHELVRWLDENEFRDPFVLISVSNGNSEIQRKLVPLDKEMTHIQFARAGENVIHATIVDAGYDRKELKNELLTRGGAGYLTSVLVWNARGFNEMSDNFGKAVFGGRRHVYDVGDVTRRHPGEEKLEVIVPKDMFAKEPARWRKALVGRFFHGAEVDQCHFRKRFGIAVVSAVTFYWVYLVVKWLANILTGSILLLGGMRGIDFWPFWNPLTGGPSDIWWNATTSVWLVKADGKDRFRIFYALNPVTLLLLVAGGLLLLKLGVPVDILVGTLVGFVVFALGIEAATLLFRSSGNPSYERASKKIEAERKKKAAKDAAMLAALETMVCNGKREASLGALPADKRTVSLRFNDLKMKVCRPFSR